MINSSLGKLSVTIGANTSQFQKSMARVSKTLRSTAQQMTHTGTRIVGVGAKSLVGLSLPLIAIGASSVKAFASFDEAMINSMSIMGDLSSQAKEQMKSVALDLSTKGVKSATELAEAYYFLSSAGLSVQASIKALPTVLAFATAGHFDLARATDLLTDAQQALGMASKDPIQNLINMRKVSDTVVTSANMANMSISQFAESLTSDSAGVMKQMNIGLADGMALLAGYASAGKKASEAGNLFGRAMRLMTSANVKNRDVWNDLGVKVFSTKGKLLPVVDTINNLSDALKKLSPEARIIKLKGLGFEQLAQKSIVPLFGMNEQLLKFRRNLKEVGGKTLMVAQKQMQSFNAQLKMTWNWITKLGIKIGQTLVPIIQKTFVPIQKFIQILLQINKSTIAFVVSISLFVASIPFVVVGIGLIVLAVGALITAFGTLTTIISFLSPFILPVFATIAIAIAGLYTGMSILNGEFLNASSFGKDWNGVLETMAGMFVIVANRIEIVYNFIKVLGSSIMVFAPLISTVFSQAFKNVQTFLGNLLFNMKQRIDNWEKIVFHTNVDIKLNTGTVDLLGGQVGIIKAIKKNKELQKTFAENKKLEDHLKNLVNDKTEGFGDKVLKKIISLRNKIDSYKGKGITDFFKSGVKGIKSQSEQVGKTIGNSFISKINENATKMLKVGSLEAFSAKQTIGRKINTNEGIVGLAQNQTTKTDNKLQATQTNKKIQEILKTSKNYLKQISNNISKSIVNEVVTIDKI